jgi:hypothetical protein
VKDGAEFKALGQNPMMGGAYVWGKKSLYVYPGFMGAGTILHEMTHALLEINFKSFPPLWLNEGLACFFEAYVDLEGEAPFGVTNWRDALYARTVVAGKARSLVRLFKECSMAIDPVGYGHGRALMLYLWSLGELEAFVVEAQLCDKGKLNFPRVLASITGRSIADLDQGLQAFARKHPKAGETIPRGVRRDEALDRAMGDGPAIEDDR